MYFDLNEILNKKPKVENSKPTIEANFITGESLINMNTKEFPTLLKPLFPKVGLIALAGSSDTGKSTFLRQFAIHVASEMDNFLGFTFNKTHNSAVLLSTEDDEYAVSYLLNKQNQRLGFPPEAFRSLRYIFETDEPVNRIDQELTREPADVVIVDAFADLYGGEMNATNKVRSFLNQFGDVAKKHECLIIFLHHTGKGKDKLEPSKHNLLGSQGFEAKMRLVMELRKDPVHMTRRHLCIVKGNYLPEEYKNESFVLEFDEHMVFHNGHERIPFEELAIQETPNKSNQKEENLERTKELKSKGYTQAQIARKLYVTEATISRYMKEITENEPF